jgi:hypothetical protein
LKTDGSVVGWGYNTYGQCNVPVPNTGFTAIAAGADHGLGLKNSLLGGCCRSDGYCTVTIQGWCVAPSVWQGAGTVCVPQPCSSSSVASFSDIGSRLVVSPNPAAGAVTINFGLQPVSISSADILDASGRLIRRIAGMSGRTGRVNPVWDGKDERGRETPGGVYMVRAVTPEGVRTGTLVRTK